MKHSPRNIKLEIVMSCLESERVQHAQILRLLQNAALKCCKLLYHKKLSRDLHHTSHVVSSIVGKRLLANMKLLQQQEKMLQPAANACLLQHVFFQGQRM